MNKKEVRTKVQRIFTDVFPQLKGKKFSFSVKQGDIAGWDSFAHMQLASAIERAFEIELAMEDVVEIDSPARFLALIEKNL